MMKLFWSPRSPFVRKVMVCAYELGIADKVEKVYALVSMSKVNPDVLRVNPIGRIPTMITDDGMVLYDSNVICEYLDGEFGGSRLFPSARPARWDTLRRLALADGILETGVLWRSESMKPAAQQSAPTIATFERKIMSALASAESEAPAPDSPRADIGDLSLGVALSYLDFRFAQLEWRGRYPRAAKWFESFDKRQSMRETVPYEE